MAYEVGGLFWDLGVNLKGFEKQLDKAFNIAKKKGAGLVWDTSSFVAGIKMTKKEFKSFGNEVSKARDKYEELLDLQKGLQSSDLWGKIGDQARDAVEKAVSAAKEEAQIYDRTLKHMGRGQKIKGVFDGLKKVFGGLFSSFRQNTAKAGAEFSGFLKRLVGIAGVAVLLRKAFSYAREGMQNLMKADATTANSVMTLRNALATLKNALASAFAPILNVVAPILAKFIGMLTAAANAVAQVLSALTGKKFATVATKISDGMSGIGGSAGSANKSAKELKRTLMGFDKINKLEGEDKGSGGGGGGGGAGGFGGMFETTPISDKMKSFADELKKSWEKADFYWLGKLIADKINAGLKKIPWKKINKNLKKVAKSLGTAFNGFVENLDWKLLGKSMSNGIKAGLNFVLTLLKTINWGAIGEAIIKFIAGIDWFGVFKKMFIDLPLALAKAIIGVVTGMLKELANQLNAPQWVKKMFDGIGTQNVKATANITSTKDSIPSSKKTLSGFTAVIKSVANGIKGGAKAVINIAKAVLKESGGIYKNGKWSPIQRYDTGGMPNGSQLFWAREKGPELVGTLGGHTAVMNNDQIVESVSSGVAKAIAGIRFKMVAPQLANTSSSAIRTQSTSESDSMQVVTLLTQILKALNEQDNNVYLDGEQIKNNVVRRINNHTRATGQLELII